jgi:hypothetical protein
MDRRKAIGRIAGVSAAAASALPAAPASERQYYELRYFQLRNGVQNTMPTARPAGLGTFGAFNPFIGENSPFLLLLLTYSSFAEAEHIDERLGAWAGYIRYERTLLRAFAGKPRLTLPPASKAGHLFELRTYESNNAATLRQKIEMFNRGEMQIFERLGMNPVFFGEALVGSKLPHLTYMLAYEDLAARDRMWKAFGSDPEWQKLRSTPGLSDADIVSNISNTILRPTAFSDIR